MLTVRRGLPWSLYMKYESGTFMRRLYQILDDREPVQKMLSFYDGHLHRCWRSTHLSATGRKYRKLILLQQRLGVGLRGYKVPEEISVTEVIS
jgi:hypothetical protein